MNIVHIVIDGLRADHLSCYGYDRPTSPTIDALAAGGVLFEQCFTPVTPTQPAITTLFTGQSPSTHRIIAQSGRHSLDGHAPWLPDILRKHRFLTISLDPLPREKRWFGRGFDVTLDPKRDQWSSTDPFRLNNMALEHISRNSTRPFFLFLHYFRTHTPYQPDPRYLTQFYQNDPTATNRGSLDAFYRRPLKPELITDWLIPFSKQYSGSDDRKIEDIGFIRSLYDAAIRTVDDSVAHLIDHLRKLRLLDDTVVIIHADHGQELGEHGIYFEQHGLYDTTIRIPLIFSWPQGICGGIRNGSMHQTLDIAPTILELAGCSKPDSMEGRSLVPSLKGMGIETGYEHILAAESTWMAKWAYRTTQHKVIVAREPDFYGKPTVEVYDLASDPNEQINLAETRSSLRISLCDQLEAEIVRRGSDVVRLHGVVRGFDSYFVEKTLREFRRPALSALARRNQDQAGTRRDSFPATEAVSEWRYPEFKAILDRLQCGIGNYAWQLEFLKKAAGKTGAFPLKLYGRLRRLLRRTPVRPYFVTQSADGILFLGDFTDSFSVACAVVPRYNRSITTALTEAVRNRPCSFVDVGANVGLLAAGVARELRGIANVYAFEPHMGTAHRAAATFALNRLTNVRLYTCAVGESDGWEDFHCVRGTSAISSVRMTALLREHREVVTTRVRIRSLDSMSAEFRWEPIGLLKVDVEGLEPDVLRGAADLIHRYKPTILFESNPLTQSDEAVLSTGSVLHGYDMKPLEGDGILRKDDLRSTNKGSDILCVPIRR